MWTHRATGSTPSKKTCAAPPSVPFGTKITVRDTGTSLSGTTYTVNDRGGAIQIKNGVYHFDLLMSSNAKCNRWGRKNGSAIIGGSGGGSGSAVLVSTPHWARSGYKESGKDINKFGQWAGHNGVAWCVYFVCWCAGQERRADTDHLRLRWRYEQLFQGSRQVQIGGQLQAQGG